MLTLLIGSPIYYWPRYGALLQFSIPYYAALLMLLFRQKDGAPSTSREAC